MTVRVSPTADECAADVALSGQAPVRLRIEASVPLATDAAPWLAAELPVAMMLGEPLVIDRPVDLAALSNSDAAQKILTGWFPALSQVTVDAERGESGEPAPGVGCFFSGGVDSFYSVLQHRDRITHLIFVLGFDISDAEAERGGAATDAARDAAASLGLPLIEVRTNLRSVADRAGLHWGTQYHGAAMAAVGLALADHVGEVIIPGSYQERDLHPWGTHPDLDPHWSSSRVRFVHDAVDVSRAGKVAYLADHPVAMDHLRVCWDKRSSAMNCGQCEKCLRTMINLRAAGALGRCRTLPSRLRLRDVARADMDPGSDLFAAENLAALRGDPALSLAIRAAVTRGRVIRRLSRIKGRAVGGYGNVMTSR